MPKPARDAESNGTAAGYLAGQGAGFAHRLWYLVQQTSVAEVYRFDGNEASDYTDNFIEYRRNMKSEPRNPSTGVALETEAPAGNGPDGGAAAATRVSAGERKHPAGLWVLFITEMWERFSYYGMRALLVLYLIAGNAAGSGNPGFGWPEADAYVLYAIYTWAVYLTPIFGGMIADRVLGTHRSMLIGGWIIAAGHITLAATELFGVSAGQAVTLQASPGALICFVSGLALVVIGTGFFKPCVSVMVGQLYREGDPRRDSGFTIFYMGINLGALMSPLVAGTLGETIGWHWGFGSAAVGMLAGLFFYQKLRPKYLKGIGLAPLRQHATDSSGRVGAGPARPPLTKVEWQRIAVILILAFVGNIFFWAAFEQAGSSMNVFAKTNTDRTLGGVFEGDGFPASWYQSVNPLVLLAFAPLFASLWVRLALRGRDPSTISKMPSSIAALFSTWL